MRIAMPEPETKVNVNNDGMCNLNFVAFLSNNTEFLMRFTFRISHSPVTFKRNICLELYDIDTGMHTWVHY